MRKTVYSVTLLLLASVLFPLQAVYSQPQPQQIISTVNQETISVENFQQRYQFSRWYNALLIRTIYEQGDMDWSLIESIYRPTLNLLRDPQSHGEFLLDRMEYEIVIKQVAEQNGIVVERGSIDALLENSIDFLSIETPNQFYQKAMKEIGIEQDIIEEVYFFMALEQILFDNIEINEPTEGLQLHIRHILLAFNPDDPYDYDSISEQQRADALARAENVLELLENGESFTKLALDYSDDALSAESGGEVPWSGENVFPPQFWEAIKDAPVQSIVGPVESQFGYHVVEILERALRPIDPRILHQQRHEAFAAWVNDKMSEAEIERHPDWKQHIPTSPTYEDLLGDIDPFPYSVPLSDGSQSS